MAEFTFSFDSASLFDSASYLVPFLALIQFLTYRGTEKTVWFSCFLYLLRLTAYDPIFCLEVTFRCLLNLMVIFRALKDKRRVLVLRKGYNISVGREIL